jgi:dipeptidyl aminopeptidase/acylaminoacyl peptidase
MARVRIAGMRTRLAFACVSTLLAAAAAQKRLTPEVLQQLARVGEPCPSPDGRWLVWSVRRTDLAANRSTSQLWVLDLQSGARRQLTSAGSNMNPCWSPDSKRLAFLSTRGGAPQAHVLAIDGGEATQVTRHAAGVANLSWSPAGDRLAFTAPVDLEQDVHELHPDLPKADARLYDSLMVRHWDAWKDGTYQHLFVVSAAGGEARDLMPGERFDVPLLPFGGGEQIAWSRDGKELCYTCKKVGGAAAAASTNSDLYVVAVEGGAPRNLTEGMPGYEIDPAWSPDGRHVAFLSMERAGFESDRNRLFVHDRQSGTSRELSKGFDQSAQTPVWSEDGQRLYFASDVRGTTQIYEVGLDGKPPRAISQGRFQFDHPRAGNGGRVFALRQQTERPPEVVELEAGRVGEGRVLTHENDEVYQKLALPKVEERWFEATDGARIHAWVVYPPDFDPARQWPMLLYCQGGPQQMVGQWFSTRWNFHLMAARGYVVLAVNRRGLPGFGQAWNDQISKDWGGQAMQDLLAATDAMQQQPFIDKKRCAAVGASFGGYTVYWLMGHAGDRFAAMIAHCGVFNLESMYAATEELFFVDWDLGGPYWRGPDARTVYERDSPHRFVGNWKTPLLVIHGEKDFRVPYVEGLQAFTAAQVRGVPSRFLYFPGEGHWVLSPQNGVLWTRVFFDWLDRWCKKEG